MGDFDDAFAEAVAEVEANPDAGSGMELPAQATIHMGDDESSAGESESGDTDGLNLEPDDDGEEVSTDETSADPEDTDTPGGFDWTAHKDDLVTLKVAGEDVEVPLGEALNGYLRHADYTRKTQELAGMRKMVDAAQQMRDALTDDPHGTVLALAKAYGVDLTPPDPADDPYYTEDPDLQPVMKRLKAAEEKAEAVARQAEARQRQDEERQVLAEVRQEMSAVKNEFADFDPTVVLPVAADKDIPIRDAYLLVKAQELLAEKSTSATKAAQAAEIAKTAAAKRKASNMANKGGSSKTAVPGKPDETFDSFEDMLTHALAG